MATWSKDELDKIAAAEELEIAPARRDGTLRRPTTIWVVRHDDDLYVRSYHGRGGGWFRLYPYGLTRRWLRAVNRAGRPFAAYLHPWEIDPDQPRLRPGRLAAFRHYVNLRRTEGRLVRLLSDFRFGTLSESLAAWRHEWAAAAAA